MSTVSFTSMLLPSADTTILAPSATTSGGAQLESHDPGASNVAIAGIVAGATVLIVLILAATWIYLRRQRAANHEEIHLSDYDVHDDILPSYAHPSKPAKLPYSKSSTRNSTMRSARSKTSLALSSVQSLAAQAREGDDTAEAELEHRFHMVQTLLGLVQQGERDSRNGASRRHSKSSHRSRSHLSLNSERSGTVASVLESVSAVLHPDQYLEPQSLSPIRSLSDAGFAPILKRMSTSSAPPRPVSPPSSIVVPHSRRPSIISEHVSLDNARIVAEAFLKEMNDSSTGGRKWSFHTNKDGDGTEGRFNVDS